MQPKHAHHWDNPGIWLIVLMLIALFLMFVPSIIGVAFR